MITNTKKILYIGIFILLIIIVYKYNFYIEKFVEININVPKKIYIFNDNSILSKVNIESLKLNTPTDWDIITLNEENISNYISKSNLDIYSKFKDKRFIDLVTLHILYYNGGIVVDSTIRIKLGEVFNNYVKELYDEEYNCSLIEFNQNNKKNTFLRNWIYIAPKNSVFIKNLHTDLYNNYLLKFNDFIKKENMLNNKTDLILSSNEAYFIHYQVINKLLKNRFLYNTKSKIEQSTKNYGIRLAKANEKAELNKNILNYIFTPVYI